MTDDLISPAAVMAQREHSATTTTHKSNQSAPVVIDVRSEEEYAAGHIAGALHIPADELADRLDEIPKDRPVVPYWNMRHRGNSRSERAATLLRESGYDAHALDGGYPAWEQAGYPTEQANG